LVGGVQGLLVYVNGEGTSNQQPIFTGASVLSVERRDAFINVLYPNSLRVYRFKHLIFKLFHNLIN
jgi:hypothetical protein